MLTPVNGLDKSHCNKITLGEKGDAGKVKHNIKSLKNKSSEAEAKVFGTKTKLVDTKNLPIICSYKPE